MEFSFSSSNFRDVPFQKYAKDFTFIINGNRYETSRFIAFIISLAIPKNHCNDENLLKWIANEGDHSKEVNISFDYNQGSNLMCKNI